MIQPALRAILESTIETNFSSITMQVPPALTDDIVFKSKIQGPTQDMIDNLAKSTKNYILIVMEYPNGDLEWLRNLSDFWGTNYSHTKENEQLPGAGDYVTVNGAVTATFSFTTSESNIGKIGFYTRIPAGSTSWLKMEVEDDVTSKIVYTKIFLTTELQNVGWNEVLLKSNHELESGSRTFNVTLSEVNIGANPVGIDVGKNGANIAYRNYYYSVFDRVGKTTHNIVRFHVFAKDKKKGRTPSNSIFMGKDWIVYQVIEALREYIWFGWSSYGFNNLQNTNFSSEWMAGTAPISYAVFDVIMTAGDWGTTQTPTIPLKSVTVEINEV
jgi:hypothetical protein